MATVNSTPRKRSRTVKTAQSAPDEFTIQFALDAANSTESVMSQIERMRVLFTAIKRLAVHDNVIADLAKQGIYTATEAHNDLDVFREETESRRLNG